MTALRQAIGIAESRWFAREARHHAVYTLAHLAAVAVAVYVILTATPAAGYHAGRLAALLDRRWA